MKSAPRSNAWICQTLTDTRRYLIHCAVEQKEKQPKAVAKPWYERGEHDPNDAEVLFWSLLLCASAESTADLDFWARRVLREEFAATEMTVQWQPNESAWPKANGVSSIYTPLIKAFSKVSWRRDALDAVALAMQAWRSAGQYDGLSGHLLSVYISSPPSAARTSRKTKPPPRYRSWAVVRVARLVHDHGPKMRKLLKLDATSDEAKPLVQVAAEQSDEVAALNATVRERDATLRERVATVAKITHAWRQAATRLKAKHSAATEARRDERAKLANERRDFAQSKSALKRDLVAAVKAKAATVINKEKSLVAKLTKKLKKSAKSQAALLDKQKRKTRETVRSAKADAKRKLVEIKSSAAEEAAAAMDETLENLKRLKATAHGEKRAWKSRAENAEALAETRLKGKRVLEEINAERINSTESIDVDVNGEAKAKLASMPSWKRVRGTSTCASSRPTTPTSWRTSSTSRSRRSSSSR